jgi:hypothetical protein
LDLVMFEEEDESPFVGLLQIEATEGHGSRNPPSALAVLLRTAQEPNRQWRFRIWREYMNSQRK